MRRIPRGRASAMVLVVLSVLGSGCGLFGSRVKAQGGVDLSGIGNDPTAIKGLAGLFRPGAASYSIDVPSAQGCGTGWVTITATASVGSSGTTYAQHTAPSNKGTLLGQVVNTGNCSVADVNLPAGATAMVFTVYRGNKAILEAYDVTNGSKLSGFRHPKVMVCPPGAPFNADALAGKPSSTSNMAVLCNHLPSVSSNTLPLPPRGSLFRLASNRLAQPPQIMDWTLWFACGADCCYGDDI